MGAAGDGRHRGTAAENRDWRVVRRIRYDRSSRIIDGQPQFGFHAGPRRFAVEFGAHWVAELIDGAVAWRAGATNPDLSAIHLDAAFELPRFVAVTPDGSVLVTDAQGVHRVSLSERRVSQLVSAAAVGVVEPGNCDVDPAGHLWLNDITGHQVIELTPAGQVVRRFGDGVDGFQLGTVPGGKARFGGIYDLRCGADGRVYVLDSTNFAVRVIEPRAGSVTTICGSGEPGSGGDGGPAVNARLGGDAGADFDGPWSLVVGHTGDIIIGDTHNHAVRRISARTGTISTIADARSSSPQAEGVRGEQRSLFTRICGMDQDASGRLLVPDWVNEETDELVVLELVPPDDRPRHS